MKQEMNFSPSDIVVRSVSGKFLQRTDPDCGLSFLWVIFRNLCTQNSICLYMAVFVIYKCNHGRQIASLPGSCIEILSLFHIETFIKNVAILLASDMSDDPDRSGVYRQCSCSVGGMYTAGTLPLAGSVCAVYKMLP